MKTNFSKVQNTDPSDGGIRTTLYPNPSTGTFTLLFTGDKTRISSTGIFNSVGEKVYESIHPESCCSKMSHRQTW